jgi:hypothetical protein
LYAKLRGYFWLPCPICGQMFGGHEKGGDLMTSWEDGLMVCPRCVDEAALRNTLWRMANVKTWPLLQQYKDSETTTL